MNSLSEAIMSGSNLRRRGKLVVVVACLMAPIGATSAQVTPPRNVTSMLISAAEDSSGRMPAFLQRFGLTTSQVEQLRAMAAQRRLQRLPILQRMSEAHAINGSQDAQVLFLQRLQDIDRAQEAEIVGILTRGQLSALQQLERRLHAGAGMIAQPVPTGS